MILSYRQKTLKMKKELLQLINEFVKAEGYKMKTQKSVAFPCTNSEQLKKEIKKRIASLFTMILVLVNLSCCKKKGLQTSSSNNKHLFFMGLEAVKFEVRRPAWLDSSEQPPPGWQMAISCYGLTCWSSEEEEESSLLSFFIQKIIP